MEYRPLGRSGLRVSPICLGTMMFALRTERPEAERIIGMARDAGVNFVDTADVYSHGGSERMLGELIAADRDSWVLATKVGNPMGPGPNEGNHSRKWLMREIDASLSPRHRPCRRLVPPCRRSRHAARRDAGAIADIVRAGKVRYWGSATSPRGGSPRRATSPSRSGSRLRSPASRSTMRSTARSRPSTCPPASSTALASCPTARWRAAS